MGRDMGVTVETKVGNRWEIVPEEVLGVQRSRQLFSIFETYGRPVPEDCSPETFRCVLGQREYFSEMGWGTPKHFVLDQDAVCMIIAACDMRGWDFYLCTDGWMPYMSGDYRFICTYDC